MPAPGELQFTTIQASHAVAFGAELSLLFFGAGLTRDEAVAYAKGLAAKHGVAPREAALVWLTGLPKSAPAEEVRAVLAKAIAHAPPSLVGLAYIVEGGGFGSSVGRSVITGLNLLVRPTLAVRTFAEPRAAVDWLAEGMHWSSVTSAAVSRALVEGRARWAQAGGTPLP